MRGELLWGRFYSFFFFVLSTKNHISDDGLLFFLENLVVVVPPWSVRHKNFSFVTVIAEIVEAKINLFCSFLLRLSVG